MANWTIPTYPVYGTVHTQSNSGTTSVVLDTGLAAAFAAFSPSTVAPMRCAVVDATASPEVFKFWLDVTAVNTGTDTLTVASRGAEGTTDANIAVGWTISSNVSTGMLNSLPLGLSIYGDGSDGTVTFDGTTTILGFAPSSSQYALTRDIWLAAGTINSGVSIKTNGYRIFCQGTLTNNGKIHWNGNDGSGSFGGNGAALSGSNQSITVGTPTFGTAGGVGQSGAGVAGTNGAATTYSFGGAGGTGGTGTSGAGGAGGTVQTAPSAASAPRLGTLLGFLSLNALVSNARALVGGSGGGGGGGDGTNFGGGAGGGGGVVIVAARAFAGTGNIQARGGVGGSPTTGNVGGGGGGGGGVVIVVSGSVASSAIAGQTVDANGGAAGAKNGTGTANAAAGSNGTVILIPN